MISLASISRSNRYRRVPTSTGTCLFLTRASEFLCLSRVISKPLLVLLGVAHCWRIGVVGRARSYHTKGALCFGTFVLIIRSPKQAEDSFVRTPFGQSIESRTVASLASHTFSETTVVGIMHWSMALPKGISSLEDMGPTQRHIAQ